MLTQTDLPMGDAKALGQPIGVYGEGKYGECRIADQGRDSSAGS